MTSNYNLTSRRRPDLHYRMKEQHHHVNHHNNHHNNHHHHGPDRGVGGGAGSTNSSNSGNKYDDPPNSRLFIVCGKSITEEDFKEAFEPYGVIEEIWVLKDKVTSEPKGVTYIKFSKTSEAALAMEEMNGRCIGTHPRPLKVLIAHSRDQGSRREMNEDERLVRLFVVVPKTMSETELKEHFGQFGDVDYVSIVRDRNSKESKGFAYVKYHRMSHAAKAFESCDRSFKPVFADPKPQKSGFHSASDGGGERLAGPGSTASASTTASVSAGYDMLTYMDTSHSNPEGNCRLSVITSSNINQDQLWRLFDLVPGLDYCELKKGDSRGSRDRSVGGSGKSVGTVVFNNPQSATYAKEKLHGFEYPIGHRLIVKYEEAMPPPPTHQANHLGPGGYPAPPPHQTYSIHLPRQHGQHSQPPGTQNFIGQIPPAPSGYPIAAQAPRMTMGAPSGPPPPPGPALNLPRQNLPTDLQSLADTIAQATSLIQAAGYTTNGPVTTNQETYDPSYCSVKLPPPQPLAPTDSPVAERLFIVCTPYHPLIYILKDVFGRFGNLIDIYLLAGKTCGYVKYASKESAEKAVTTLHGQEVCGNRLKVMLADPQDPKNLGDPRKRPKIMDQD